MSHPQPPFFNIFSTLHLESMTRGEALELIRQPCSATPFTLEEHARLILDLGGFHPFFLQQACSATFKILLEEDECVEDRVRERFFEEVRPHFQVFWDRFDPVVRALCNDIACSREVDRERSDYGELAKRAYVVDGDRLFSSSFAEFVQQSYARDVGGEPLEVQADRLRSMEGELQKAHELQMALLPQEKFESPGLDVAGRCVPATHVGGDFYTYLWLDEAQTILGIVSVDVMGHGMEGMVTAMRFSETLRYESRGGVQPADILQGLNQALHGSLREGEFVACCIGVSDVPNRRCEVSVGGYYPPLHFERERDLVDEPNLGNMPLGLKAGLEYNSLGLELGSGDLLLFHSDGVVETQDSRQSTMARIVCESCCCRRGVRGLRQRN